MGSQPRLSRLRVAIAAAVAAVAGAAGLTGLLATPLTPAAVHADSSFDSALFSLLNQDRASHGLGAVQWNGALGTLAESSPYGGCGFTIDGRAEDMVQRNYFSHTILDCGGRTVFDIMRADGIAFTSAGENIGWVSGISDPNAAAQYVNNQFMNSPEHVANILNGDFTTAGIGSWWTASGQTWSGAGSAQKNVLVVAEEFTATPSAAPPPPPPPPVHHAAPPVTHSSATPALSSPAAPAAPAAAPTAAPAPAATEPTGPDDARPGRAYGLPGVETGVWHVVAKSGSITKPAPISLAMTCGGVLMGTLMSLRGALTRRRRRRSLDLAAG